MGAGVESSFQFHEIEKQLYIFDLSHFRIAMSLLRNIACEMRTEVPFAGKCSGKRRSKPYQRRQRDPHQAPIATTMAIASVYQAETNKGESSVQCVA